ncbi:MAG: hypothetical protein JKY55_07715 [Aliivibrio sp.]|uniref:DUF6916 family protein n=1 Tax=Aliivibrio sp. TaxID=1872443 RepID=UPI001A5244FF|nr:hypothetical protein [Aliivibrio sp.]
MTDPNKDFCLSILKPLVGELFKVTDVEGGVVNLWLSELEEDVIKGFEGESFIASFKGEENALPPEGTCQIEHEKIGCCEVMLSPSSATICHVVISRLK